MICSLIDKSRLFWTRFILFDFVYAFHRSVFCNGSGMCRLEQFGVVETIVPSSVAASYRQ